MIRQKTREQGTYALILYCAHEVIVHVGALGDICFSPGYYVYVGSAHGPGGIFARLRRHFASNKRMHWHIDYLTERLQIVAVWFSYAERDCEHEWASAVQEMPGARVVVQGFGSSDCSCRTHLFHFCREPDVDNFLPLIRLRGCAGTDLVVERYNKLSD